jgi:hypothetical protein
MDRAAIVACPIMVVGVVMLCGGCPPEHPKKRPPVKRCSSLQKPKTEKHNFVFATFQ